MQFFPRDTRHGRRSADRPSVLPSRGAKSVPLPTRPIIGRYHLAVGVVSIALIAGISLAPDQSAEAAPVFSSENVAGQVLKVDGAVTSRDVIREPVTATDGVQTFVSNGTNADWAKLVLLYGNWPQSDANVTAMLRWMRQENGPQDWWNRNNPLNNGYGSGGGAGLGSYSSLAEAAEYAASNLQRGYPDIVANFVSGVSADATASAIWASPWASSHYGNGTHWSTAPVPVVQAPASAWQ